MKEMLRDKIAKIIAKHTYLRKHQPIEQGYLDIADEIIDVYYKYKAHEQRLLTREV